MPVLFLAGGLNRFSRVAGEESMRVFFAVQPRLTIPTPQVNGNSNSNRNDVVRDASRLPITEGGSNGMNVVGSPNPNRGLSHVSYNVRATVNPNSNMAERVVGDRRMGLDPIQLEAMILVSFEGPRIPALHG
ncbi:hypothetical protein NE237_028482 [Protea cynaroides]|uniref:Uncharacterized protein n=1 Tax=Protea cynaroides TaxID=273540 RepID=A0A9Q0JV68_9MAGN|nr:hypothetical protein NE237_028482 [Protea cynaroides]